MPALKKVCLNAGFFVLFSIISSSSISAQIFINEILPNPSEGNNEWVELYNNSSEAVDVSAWILVDAAGHQWGLTEVGSVAASGYAIFTYFGDGWLNNGGDSLFLKNGDALIDSYTYTISISEDVSFGRYPDGASDWQVLNMVSPGEANAFFLPSTTPLPSLVPILTLVATPVTENGKCRIGEVKNQMGETLSSVKIYIDDVYISHYAPEEIIFCSGCKCSETDCDFGNHKIKLTKAGYLDWSENRTINSGDNLEINAVMVVVSPTPIADKSTSIPPTLTPTQIPTLFSELTIVDKASEGGVLSESDIGLLTDISLNSTNEEKSDKSSNDDKEETGKILLPFLLIGGGILLIVPSAVILKKEVGSG